MVRSRFLLQRPENGEKANACGWARNAPGGFEKPKPHEVPMTPKVIFKLGSEVLQPSALHDFEWPASDPADCLQKTRPGNETDSNLLNQAVDNFPFSSEAFEEQTRGQSIAQKAWYILTAKAFNFNGAQVRGETVWTERIEQAVERNEPIRIAYPLVCKINNPSKRMTIVGCTAGERAIIRFFSKLNQLIQKIYPPGLKIYILSDATLYNNALQVPPPSAYAYMTEFAQLISAEGAAGFIELLDYTAELAPFYREFESLYNRHYQELAASPLTVETMGSLPTSVRASLNTHRFGFRYEDLLKLFGPRQTGFLPVRVEIDQLALYALREQLAIKMACDEFDLPARLWPNHIRATCHKGLKSGRHVLGLRPYPEYYGASKLLPYHGMPLIEPDKRGILRLLILPEISLRSDGNLERITNEHGEPVLYRR
jgi:hypothetical protein